MLSAGAIGFVGSVVMEQILRLCPDVSKIFLLIRSKADRSGESLAAGTLRARKTQGARQRGTRVSSHCQYA